MRYLILSLALSLTCACSREPDDQVHAGKSPTAGTTATDQSNEPSELELTQRVRQALVDDSMLSVGGKNITVVSKGTVVTLRGTVASADEEARIKTLVKGVAGVGSIDDQLEIKP